VKVTFWGTRGSLAAPGPETLHYGGNTVCVEVRVSDDHVVILDAGTGIRRLGAALGPSTRRIDLLLSHLHMDHIIGLGFFAPLRQPDLEVHLWGPASTTLDLGDRLGRYLSPPLFPVHVRELECRLTLHDVPLETFEVPGFRVHAALVGHPGPTVGYRLEHDDGVVTYLSDHEPALGVPHFPGRGEWTSGFDLALDADLLIHDAQYDGDEYARRQGWGHSAIEDTIAFARLTHVRHLVAFHHDPEHDDATLDAMFEPLRTADLPFDFTVACEGMSLQLRERSGSVSRPG
jgi:phosphoribosyl 1,2-cyclic phosphodiesterase